MSETKPKKLRLKRKAVPEPVPEPKPEPVPEPEPEPIKRPRKRVADDAKPKNEVVEDAACPICADAYTSVVRKEVECNQCHKKACVKCVETYMCSSLEDPHCMHCRTSWPRTFLNTVCSNTFLNKTYYTHRQTVLLNREKSFLPAYQVIAEREVKARAMGKDDIELATKQRELELEMSKKIAVIQAERTALWRRIRNVREGRDENAITETAKAAASKFIRRCTVPECNGFLSSAWKCGLCGTWACPDCFEIKGLNRDAPHTCTADALATAELIRKDTKPCPSCGEMISKIDGCDQMFCTSCHKPFSWNTGQSIKTGHIHNPHYFQWLAKGGQLAPTNPGFVPCGGLPNAYHVQAALRAAPKQDRKEILDILRICYHIMDVERHRYERHLDPLNNESIGVRYLMKEVKEEEWKRELARKERDRQKSNEIRDILDAFNGAAIDLFRRIEIGTTYSAEAASTLINQLRVELEALRTFSFQAMNEVGKFFNCSVPWVSETWEMQHGTERTRRLKEERAAADAATIRATAGAAAAIAAAEVAADIVARAGLNNPE